MFNFTVDGFYDLSLSSDNFSITPGLLAPAPNGLRALDGADTVQGSSDSEKMNGNQGNDVLLSGGGNDQIWGGQDNDTLGGEDGNDTVNGNKGLDYVIGGAGNDTIRGGQDSDILVGGIGEDWLIGDRSSDVLAGNEGSDLFVLSFDPVNPEPADSLLDFNPLEGDQIGLTGGLTEADLLFEPFSQSLSEALLSENIPGLAGDLGIDLPPNFASLLSPELIRFTFEELTDVNIDPDQDGIVSGTLIKVATTGQEIGLAFNVNPTDLAGGFVTLSDEQLLVG